jgi:predicted nicotinamide N-methyase
MPAVSRKFSIPYRSGSIDIVLHEPSLTADNLGLKTWAASFLLAKRLAELKILTCDPDEQIRILELGSGTGLVGIAAAAIFHGMVHLSDLPDIIPNLSRNVKDNRDAISSHGGTASTGVLDWSIRERGSLTEQEKYPLILAADPLYSPEHPMFLVQTVERWLRRSKKARFVMELPLRDAYSKERSDFSRRINAIGLVVEEEGEEVGYDDWQARNGGLVDVKCWWGVFKWRDPPKE